MFGDDDLFFSSGGAPVGLRVSDDWSSSELDSGNDKSGSNDVEEVSAYRTADNEPTSRVDADSGDSVSTADSLSAMEQVRLLHYNRKSFVN